MFGICRSRRFEVWPLAKSKRWPQEKSSLWLPPKAVWNTAGFDVLQCFFNTGLLSLGYPVTLPASSFSSHLEAHSGRFLAKGNAHMEYCPAAFNPQANIIVVAPDLPQGLSDALVHLLCRGCAPDLQHGRTPVPAVPDNDVVQALL